MSATRDESDPSVCGWHHTQRRVSSFLFLLVRSCGLKYLRRLEPQSMASVRLSFFEDGRKVVLGDKDNRAPSHSHTRARTHSHARTYAHTRTRTQTQGDVHTHTHLLKHTNTEWRRQTQTETEDCSFRLVPNSRDVKPTHTDGRPVRASFCSVWSVCLLFEPLPPPSSLQVSGHRAPSSGATRLRLFLWSTDATLERTVVCEMEGREGVDVLVLTCSRFFVRGGAPFSFFLVAVSAQVNSVTCI